MLEPGQVPKGPDETWFAWPATWVNPATHANVIGKGRQKDSRISGTHTFLPPQTLVGKLRSLSTPLHRITCRAISFLSALHIGFYQYHLIGAIVAFIKISAFVDYCSLGNQSTVA
jgi:hypothetical protein